MENNSKQAVLSIVGIAILVIAVVGVSFAFFTYSKEGSTDNVITTGSITFSYEELNELSLINQFPQADAGDNDTFNFKVTGNIPETSGAVSYTVTAVKGSVPATGDYNENTDRLLDSEVTVQVSANGGGTVAGNYATGASVDSANGSTIATGTIAAGTTAEHNYSMTMWVNETVTISDTDTTKTYRASAAPEGSADTRRVYSDLYYSLKVNVAV